MFVVLKISSNIYNSIDYNLKVCKNNELSLTLGLIKRNKKV